MNSLRITGETVEQSDAADRAIEAYGTTPYNDEAGWGLPFPRHPDDNSADLIEQVGGPDDGTPIMFEDYPPVINVNSQGQFELPHQRAVREAEESADAADALLQQSNIVATEAAQVAQAANALLGVGDRGQMDAGEANAGMENEGEMEEATMSDEETHQMVNGTSSLDEEAVEDESTG